MMKWMLLSLFLPQDVVDHHLQMPCKWSSWHWPMYHLCSHGYSIWEVPSGFHASQCKSGGAVCAALPRHVYRENKNLNISCSHWRQGIISCCILYVKFSLSSHLHRYSSVSPDMLQSPLDTMMEPGRKWGQGPKGRAKISRDFSPVHWSQAFLSCCFYFCRFYAEIFSKQHKELHHRFITFRCICSIFFPSKQSGREVVFQNVSHLPINATVCVS